MIVNIEYTVEELASITFGKLNRGDSLPTLSQLLLDSRKVEEADKTIFFLLHSLVNKGIEIIDDLVEKGVACFIVNSHFPFQKFPFSTFIIVEDVVKALQQLAIFHRQKFNTLQNGKALPVIGITGSNGKTIVKEWLNTMLEGDHNIVRSQKSYNSQIGVPLSVLQMQASDTLAIFEAGISTTGEMQKLEQMIRPDIGIFTNIGTAHDEGFANTKEKINEKLQLFINAEVIIFSLDYPKLLPNIQTFIKSKKSISLFSWSRQKIATLQIISIQKFQNRSRITGVYKGKKNNIEIAFTDDASIENAINCWCVLLFMNYTSETILKKMQLLFPVQMRLELEKGINNCTIINDSYSADLVSLNIALDFLQQQTHDNHTLILSDILQTGKTENELYGAVAKLLHHKKVNKFIGIGNGLIKHQDLFKFIPRTNFFDSVKTFQKTFKASDFSNEIVLLKGARSFRFEQVNQLLKQKAHQTILSINLDAIVHNLKAFKNTLLPDTKLMAMVKAFGYGSGSFEVAQVLQYHKTDYLAVAYADEGVELRKAGIILPIMIMNPEENTFNTLVEHNLEPEIFSFGILRAFDKFLLSAAIINYPVHIKCDTGMHRLGFRLSEMKKLANILKHTNHFKVKSVFSHLAASESPAQDAFTLQQSAEFKSCCDILEERLKYSFLTHISNTSGISRHPNLQLDMVRLGIGLYGIASNKAMQKKLRHVSTLSSTVAQIKKVSAGESVGYGRGSFLKKDTLVATVRIGYADGYDRGMGNGVGKMLYQGKLVPVIGNVCMDMTLLDISAIQNAKEGDEVIVFGEDLPVEKLAQWLHTIPYEIMTGISSRVKRVYYQE
ncbi:MAG: bifunctional UDP-N-acetylmuramoyl-tripeptide:D-alanyl-D-alanine ligase/alanine racemase [Ginsengibacter sp.]